MSYKKDYPKLPDCIMFADKEIENKLLSEQKEIDEFEASYVKFAKKLQTYLDKYEKSCNTFTFHVSENSGFKSLMTDEWVEYDEMDNGLTISRLQDNMKEFTRRLEEEGYKIKQRADRKTEYLIKLNYGVVDNKRIKLNDEDENYRWAIPDFANQESSFADNLGKRKRS